MKTIIIIILACFSFRTFAQSGKITIDQAIEIALKNNAGIRSARYEVDLQKELKKTSIDLPKTNISLLYGQYNSFVNDNNFTVTQVIPFSALGSQGALNRSLVVSSELKKASTENELIYQVRQTYFQLAYLQTRHGLLIQQDSIYEGFLKAASARYKSGEAYLLEETTAETQRNEVRNQLRLNESSITIMRTQLKTLLNSNVLPEIPQTSLSQLSFPEMPDTTVLLANPSLAYMRQQVDVAQNRKRLENARFAPDLIVGYFNQTLIDVVNTENGAVANRGNRFTGFQVGLAVPLWFLPHQGRAKAAAFNQKAAQSNYQYYQITLQGQLQQAEQQFTKNINSLAYYQTSALPNADLIIRQAQIAFRQGQIGYTEYLLSVKNAMNLREGYLQTLNEYNQSIIYIEYLSGNK
ncbi:MAG: TolC family protein [Cyclobacteriaceae bacterium]|nr:TolC family protein [Cyclobacteriaceae bacterium]